MDNNFEMEFKEDQESNVPKQDNQQKAIHVDFDIQMNILTVVFKVLSIIFYFIFKIIVGIDILTFIIVVLMITFDFWVTKNLTGRRLAGLRWWTQFNQQDQQQWVFQSCQPNRVLDESNITIFWTSQFGIVLFWIVISLINIVTLSVFWSLLALFCTFLEITNLYCYFKCKGQHQKKIKSLATKVGFKFMQNKLNEQS